MKRFIAVLAAALSLTLLVSGCGEKPKASSNAKPSAGSTGQTSSTSSNTGTAQNTPGATVPVQEGRPEGEPVVDADGTYHFFANKTEYTGKLLTDFSKGTISTKTDYGAFTFENGIISAETNGSLADIYDIYKGEDLSSADYSKVTYIGIRVVNNKSSNVLFGLQGRYINGGKTFFMGETGEDILLAYDDGRYFSAPMNASAGRFCATVPGKFTGHVLIPVSRIYDDPDMNSGSPWADTRPAFEQLGFHVSGPGSETVDISGLLMYEGDLPKAEELPESQSNITNPEYSYTDEQRMTPFWQSSIMYNESLAMIQKGSEISGTLLFVPKRIITVVDVTMQKEYTAGVDYEWIEGTNKIKWLSGSTIPYFFEGALKGLKEEGGTEYVQGYNNAFDETGRARLGNVLYCVGEFLYGKQICVTYEYDTKQIESQGILHAQYQGDKLPKTTKKLADKERLNVLFYGDSIFSGCDASGMYGRQPNMPMMHNLIRIALQDKTGSTIRMSNIAVGGWSAENGLAALTGSVSGKDYSNRYKDYDLLILSFGMNNGGTSAASYKETTKKTIQQIRTKSPDIEIVLVSCMVPNPEAAGFYGNQKLFGAALKELAAEENCAVVDFFAIHEKILEYKNYISTSGNNINHPNDWLIRVYAQNIVSAIVKE